MRYCVWSTGEYLFILTSRLVRILYKTTRLMPKLQGAIPEKNIPFSDSSTEPTAVRGSDVGRPKFEDGLQQIIHQSYLPHCGMQRYYRTVSMFSWRYQDQTVTKRYFRGYFR